jgi:predicted RNA-binding protein YlqC (UPF0109 family)
MKQFLEYVVPNLVTHPEEVQVSEETKEGVIHLMIKVNPEDVGRVIGKSGKIIKSLRQLVRVMAIKQGVRVNVDVADSQNNMVDTPVAEETPQEVAEETEEIETSADEDELQMPEMPSETTEETPAEETPAEETPQE